MVDKPINPLVFRLLIFYLFASCLYLCFLPSSSLYDIALLDGSDQLTIYNKYSLFQSGTVPYPKYWFTSALFGLIQSLSVLPISESQLLYLLKVFLHAVSGLYLFNILSLLRLRLTTQLISTAIYIYDPYFVFLSTTLLRDDFIITFSLTSLFCLLKIFLEFNSSKRFPYSYLLLLLPSLFFLFSLRPLFPILFIVSFFISYFASRQSIIHISFWRVMIFVIPLVLAFVHRINASLLIYELSTKVSPALFFLSIQKHLLSPLPTNLYQFTGDFLTDASCCLPWFTLRWFAVASALFLIFLYPSSTFRNKGNLFLVYLSLLISWGYAFANTKFINTLGPRQGYLVFVLFMPVIVDLLLRVRFMRSSRPS